MQLAQLAAFLQDVLQGDRYPDDPPGIYRDSAREVKRLGLALEPFAGLEDWIEQEQLDAVWLHRPWQLNLQAIPADLGVLTHHLAFDEHLTLGYNPHLAKVLNLSQLEVLGTKQDRPIGMIGTVPGQPVEVYSQQVQTLMGGWEAIQMGSDSEVTRVAVVGAMTDALVREACDRGAQIYITGQLRQPARAAMIEIGMMVIAVGHKRSEQWGLHTLAELLQAQWTELETVIEPS